MFSAIENCSPRQPISSSELPIALFSWQHCPPGDPPGFHGGKVRMPDYEVVDRIMNDIDGGGNMLFMIWTPRFTPLGKIYIMVG